jgi:hypothetical protein
MQRTLRAAAAPAAPRRTRAATATRASAGAPPADAAGTVTLGKSGVVVSEMGLGAWSWGDRSGYWSNDTPEAKVEAEAAYVAAIEAGLTFIDTAEVRAPPSLIDSSPRKQTQQQPAHHAPPITCSRAGLW